MSVVVDRKVPGTSTPMFSRHETFPPRNGWLKKSFDAFVRDGEVFSREDAPITLGVGKNMAKAMRYWALAFKIGEEQIDKGSKIKTLVPTSFGKLLLADDGWDPYLEDVSSLWLLHWKLLQEPWLATSWAITYNYFRHPEFTQDDLLSEIATFAKQTWPDSDFSEATLRNDVSCFTRMYARDDSNKHVSEETIGSPFTELDLLTRLNGGKHLAFHIGPKSNLSNSILAAAALEFAHSIRSSETSISISQLAYGIGSPGLAFKLPESSIYAALEEVAESRKDLSISQTAGMVQLQFTKEPNLIAEDVLARFYTNGRR